MANKRVYLLMVLATLFWAGAFITGKMAVREFPPFALTFFRFLFALPFIFVILKIRQPEDLIPKKEHWWPLTILGIMGTFGYHALFFSSLQHTTAINSSLIGATNPMVTVLLAIIFFGEIITLSRALGIILSFSGVFLIVTKGDWQIISNFRFNVGDILMFAAVWSWALYSVLSRRFMEKYGLTPLMLTAYTFLICTVFSVPFFLWEQPANYLFQSSWQGWGAIIYMAVFASVLGYLFQLMAIQQIGAPKSAIFINLVPVFTIVLSVALLGESLSWFKLMCAGIIVSGVYLTSRPEGKENRAKTNGHRAIVKEAEMDINL